LTSIELIIASSRVRLGVKLSAVWVLRNMEVIATANQEYYGSDFLIEMGWIKIIHFQEIVILCNN